MAWQRAMTSPSFPAPPTVEQLGLAGWVEATGPRHLVEYRVSLPLPFLGRYYVAVVLGREARSQRRLAKEGQTRLSRLMAVVTALLTFGFGLFCVLYLLKCYAGIDLFPGHSPFHPLYVLFFS